MAELEKKIRIMRRYSALLSTSSYVHVHVKGNIPSQKIDNALKSFAAGMDKTTIIGFIDITLTENGKEGYIFTDTKMYCKPSFAKAKKIWYDDIRDIQTVNNEKIIFKLEDGQEISWYDSSINMRQLVNLLNELKKFNEEQQAKLEKMSAEKLVKARTSSAAMSGGLSLGHYQEVNRSFDEEKFHSRQGHGFAAERANNLYDELTGHDAQILGDNNEKNGADRIVDGIKIQSKYCKTGSRCINECFAEDGKGTFRYLDNGKPMQIEVPSDKYEAALEAMQEKIRRGQVPGVTDPKEAENIVRKGHFTYEQALNIAKAGTVESITYDAVNGAIIASSALGVTFVLTFATSIWNGEDINVCIKNATYSGLKVGGTAFITTVIASQLSKAGLNSALVSSSEAIARIMGPKASAIVINAFRSSGNIYGAAAMKSFAKLLRGNAITAGVTIVVLSSFDIANIFRGRISGKQLFKNVTNTTVSVGAGVGGFIAGQALIPIPVVGGLLGSVVVGGVAGKASNAILDKFIEDDAEEMVRIVERVFSELAVDYILSQKEAEKAVDALKETLNGKILKNMYASSDREKFACDLLHPIIEKEVKKRKKIVLPSDEQVSNSLRSILEEIYETSDKKVI